MKPFDLEAAKRGDPIQTRDGRKARFIAHVPECSEAYRVIGLIDGCQVATSFTEHGKHLQSATNLNDLFMAPKKRVVWVNFYKDNTCSFFETQEVAHHFSFPNTRIGNRAYPVEIDDE